MDEVGVEGCWWCDVGVKSVKWYREVRGRFTHLSTFVFKCPTPSIQPSDIWTGPAMRKYNERDKEVVDSRTRVEHQMAS